MNWLQLGQAVPCSAAQVSQDPSSGDRDAGDRVTGSMGTLCSSASTLTCLGRHRDHTHGVRREILTRCHPRLPAPPRALLGVWSCWRCPILAGDRHPAQAVLAEPPCTTVCKTFHFSLLSPSAPLPFEVRCLYTLREAFAAGESGQRGFPLDLNSLEMLHPVWKRTSGFVPCHGGEQQGIVSHHLCF